MKAEAKRKPRKRVGGMSAGKLRIHGIYMGLLNGLSKKNRAKAKAVCAKLGVSRAVGWIRTLGRERAAPKKAA